MKRLLLLLGIAVSGASQAPDDFHPLVTPAAGVGECVPPPPARNGGAGRELVITATSPVRRREIIVGSDTAGRAVSYFEWIFVGTGKQSANFEIIGAGLEDDGRISGLHNSGSTSINKAPATDNDSVFLREMMEGPVNNPKQAPLTDAEKKQVRAIVTWMLTRCPAMNPPVTMPVDTVSVTATISLTLSSS